MKILRYIKTSSASLYLKLGFLFFIAAVYFFIPGVREFVVNGMLFLHYRDFDGLRSFILSYGVWAPATSIALMAIQSIVPMLPGVIITLINAWIFGWKYGALYSWTGALIGAVLDFALARWYGRPVVEKFVSAKYVDLTDDFFKRYGVLAVFATRLTPVVPFKVVSYGSGLTAISPFKFTVSTALGQTPAIILYSILGQDLLNNFKTLIWVTLVFLAIACCIFYYRRKIESYLLSNKPQD